MGNTKRLFTILVDKTIGELSFSILSFLSSNNKIKIDKKNIKNILVIRPGGIGDFLLAVPLFKRIRKEFPKAKLTLFCFKRNFKTTELYTDFDNVMVIDKPINFLKFLFSKKQYDLVIDTEQVRKIPSIISLLSKANIRIGFDTNTRRKAYTNLIEYSHKDYEAMNFLRLLSPITKKLSLKEQDLLIKPKHELIIKGKNIGIYAAAMKIENRLPISAWKKIIEKQGKDKNYYFLGGKEDKERYDEIEKEMKGYNIKRFDGKSLSDSFSLISALDLLIAEDGGPFHMAVCAGIPTISFWGPTVMSKWKAPFPKHKGIQSKLSCVPCTFRKFAEFPGCPYDNKCMKEMKV